MTETEIIERAETLPDRFADRVTESTLWSIKRMRGGGEYGELTIELAASLAAHNTPVTPGERDELRTRLEAMALLLSGVGAAVDAVAGSLADPGLPRLPAAASRRLPSDYIGKLKLAIAF